MTIIYSGTSDLTAYIYDSDNSIVKQVSLNNSSQRLVLHKGEYSVNVVTPEKQSTYESSLKFFSTNKVSIELRDQQESTFIGRSSLSCSKLLNNKPIFYSCNPGNFGQVSTTRLNQLQDSQPSAIYSDATQLLKPSGENFLVKKMLDEKTATFSLISNYGDQIETSTVSSPQIAKIASDQLFATSTETERFAFFDDTNSQIISYDNIKDKNPAIIQVEPNELGTDEYSKRLVVGKKYTYLIYFKSELHPHDNEEATPSQQKIFVYEDDNLLESKEIKREWFISKISDSLGEKILFSVFNGQKNESYIFSDNSFKQVLFNTPHQDACWKDDNTFYYIANEGKSIYTYSFNQGVSYLVYDGLSESNALTSLSCAKGQLTFVIKSSLANTVNLFDHYRLGNDPFQGSGMRLEAILPFYFSLDDTNTLQASLDGPSIYINKIYGSTNPDKEAVKNKLYSELKSRGISVEPNIIFSY